jgi:hypothetical protein
MRRLRQLLLLGLLLAACAWAQRQMSVAQLEQFIKSSLELKHPDRQVADVLKGVRMTQRLDAATVENLQALGAGPRTREALRALMAASASLPPPPPAAAPPPVFTLPPPSEAEQRAILEEVRRNALDYTNNLPNFICTQITRRHVDPTGNGAWRLVDTIQEQLSFVDKKEDYKVVLVNNLAVQNISHEQLGGTTTSGEFGTMLHAIFKPETQTEFQWERWATLRGRRTHVFSFRVLQRNSEYSIYDAPSGRRMIGGYHGFIYADAETRMVMRIKMDVDGLENFPIQRVGLELNYDFVEISGRNYVLPLKAEIHSGSFRYASRNEVEFRRYRRFSADATILYDVPEPIPPDQLEEQPVH